MRALGRGAILFILLLGGVAAAAERVKIVVLDVEVNDSSPDEAERQRIERLGGAINEQILTELSHAGRFQVVGKSDIAAILGLERQKQLLGCAEDSSACLAELAGALGSPYLMSAALSRVGSKLRLDLKLLQTEKGEVLGRQGASLGSEDEVFGVVADLVGKLASNPVFGDAVKPPSRAPPVVMGAAGLAAALAGGVVLGVQFSQGDVLQSRPEGFTIVEAEQRRASIYALRPIGAGLVAGGLVIAAASTVWFAVSGSPSRVSFVPVSGGAFASWSTTW